jgi:hypothetical protein
MGAPEAVSAMAANEKKKVAGFIVKNWSPCCCFFVCICVVNLGVKRRNRNELGFVKEC